MTTVPTAHLAITPTAATVTAGKPFTFTVSALDSTDAVVPTYAGTVQKSKGGVEGYIQKQ